jgi:hypothetical protein
MAIKTGGQGGVPQGESSQGQTAQVPLSAKVASTLWIGLGMYGSWEAVIWMMASLVGPSGIGGNCSAVQGQLFGVSVLTVWLGARLARGRLRDLWLAMGIASFCGAMVAATIMSREPYEILRWWVTSALLTPVRPMSHFDPPGSLFWLVVAITVLGDGLALIARPSYLMYRRQLPRRLSDKGPWDPRARAGERGA